MTSPRKVLTSHLKEIVNGRFRPEHRVVGTDTPLHCATFRYGGVGHPPLRTTAETLSMSVANLLTQLGHRQAVEWHDYIDEIYSTGVPMLADDFVVIYREPRKRIDIVSSSGETANSLLRAVDAQVDAAVDVALGHYRLCS